MRNLTLAEKTTYGNCKTNMLDAKAALRLMLVRLSNIADTHHAAGEFAEESAAMDLRSAVLKALGELDAGHGPAMRALLALFTNGGDVIGPTGLGGR